MKIIVPMAGEGQRFIDEGYKTNKALLPVIYRKDGVKYPMVICAVKDVPGVSDDGDNICFIMRDFHFRAKIDEEIKEKYCSAHFIEVNHLTEGQACTCMLASSFVENEEELLIAACDIGMHYDISKFEGLKKKCDIIVFTFRNNPVVLDNPDAFGWIEADEFGNVKSVSIKKHISDLPEKDHAIVGAFWFKHSKIFVDSTKKMIDENDRVNGEYYVDESIKHAIDLKFKVAVFEIDKFINYGSPQSYEMYNKTIQHYSKFIGTNYYLCNN